jgi:hypothetical protein
MSCQLRVALAQDSELRHVVIKVLLSDSEEFKVLNFLQQEKILLDQFCGVIPVLDMLPFGTFQFAVLPRCVVRNMYVFCSQFLCIGGVTGRRVPGLEQQKMFSIISDVC